MFSHHLLLTLLGQTTAEPVPLNWSNLVLSVIGSIPVATVLGWRLNLRDKEIQRLQDELRANSDKTLAMAERAIPALVEATRTLSEVRAAMDSPRASGTELDRVMRQLERLTEDMQRGK